MSRTRVCLAAREVRRKLRRAGGRQRWRRRVALRSGRPHERALHMRAARHACAAAGRAGVRNRALPHPPDVHHLFGSRASRPQGQFGLTIARETCKKQTLETAITNQLGGMRAVGPGEQAAVGIDIPCLSPEEPWLNPCRSFRERKAHTGTRYYRGWFCNHETTTKPILAQRSADMRIFKHKSEAWRSLQSCSKIICDFIVHIGAASF
jgi:hypothetical protein